MSVPDILVYAVASVGILYIIYDQSRGSADRRGLHESLKTVADEFNALGNRLFTIQTRMGKLEATQAKTERETCATCDYCCFNRTEEGYGSCWRHSTECCVCGTDIMHAYPFTHHCSEWRAKRGNNDERSD